MQARQDTAFRALGKNKQQGLQMFRVCLGLQMSHHAHDRERERGLGFRGLGVRV